MSRSTTISNIASFLLLLLIERRTSLHGHERRAAWFKSRRNPAKRLTLPALLLILVRTEEGFTARSMGCDRCTAVGLGDEDVRLESVGVDKLGGFSSNQSDNGLSGDISRVRASRVGASMRDKSD
jgi:hypothetical protein